MGERVEGGSMDRGGNSGGWVGLGHVEIGSSKFDPFFLGLKYSGPTDPKSEWLEPNLARFFFEVIN